MNRPTSLYSLLRKTIFCALAMCLSTIMLAQNFFKTYSEVSPSFFYNLKEKPDGFEFVSEQFFGSQFLLNKLGVTSTNGNLVFSQELDFTGGRPIFRISDGNYIRPVESGIDFEGVFERLDADGNLLNSFSFAIPSGDVARYGAVDEFADGDLFVAYYYGEAFSGVGLPEKRAIAYAKVNPTTGTVAWEGNFESFYEKFQASPYLVEIAPDGNIFMAIQEAQPTNLNNFICKISPTGTLLWRVEVSTLERYPIQLVVTDDGGVAFVFNQVFGDVRKLDADGNPAGSVFLDPVFQSAATPTAIVAAPNNQILAAGTATPPNSGGQVMYTAFIDENMNVVSSNVFDDFPATPRPRRGIRMQNGEYAFVGQLGTETFLMTVNENGEYDSAFPCSGNLLTNPGFEDGLDGWNPSGDVTITTDAYSGSKAAKVGGGDFASLGQALPTVPGKSYILEAMAKYTGSLYKSIQLRFLDASWNTIQGASLVVPVNSTSYSQHTLSGTAPNGAAFVYALILKDGNGSIEADDFCLRENGNTTCVDDVTLTSQAEVDAWAGCTVIDGQLSILSPFGPNGASSDITDLSPLLNLKEVTGVIFIQNNDELFSLTGLENVTSSDGIVIQQCENINDIQALSGLSGEVNFINIIGNPSLTSIDGLEGITKVNSSVDIASNSSLQNLNGLSNLVEVNGSNLLLSDNPLLTDIQGLSNLTHVNATFIIVNCDGLVNLAGLQNLVTAKGFVLSSNEVLSDVSAVNSLSNVENTFFVAGNPMLSDCCIFTDLLNSNVISGLVTIEDNAPGCNSEQEIIDTCDPSTCTGDVLLTSQAEVDAWPGCTVVEGNLRIAGEDIMDLSPLITLQKVRGTLSIDDNLVLINLMGLKNVDSVGVLIIAENAVLQNISALNLSQTEIESIILYNNDNLHSISGLNNFTSAGFMEISGHDNLSSITGFNGLTTVEGNLLIEFNDGLTDFGGFANLNSVAENFQLVGNNVLAEINGFGNLSTVDGNFIVSSNSALANINGFSGLSDLHLIAIAGNPLLENLDVFSSITSISGDLNIINNANLSNCCGVYPLLNSGGVGGNVSISGNPMFCASEQEILDNCEPSGDIDLSINLTQPNAAPAQWNNYEVTLTIENSGPMSATGVKVSFSKPTGVVYVGGNEFIASQGTFNPNGNEVWTVGSLSAGSSATLTVNYFLLASESPVAWAEVSAANEADTDSTPGNGNSPTVNEDDEASTGGGGPPNLIPDLTLSNLDIQNAPITAGQVLQFHFDISNQGNGPASGNFTVKPWISTDQFISPDDIQNGVVSTGNFGAGLTQTVMTGLSLVPANLASGSYFLILKVDADDEVAESNEANNLVSVPFTVAGQVCPGNITLSTQAEVDAFDCEVVDGDLTIEGNDIVDLSPLLVLKHVGGILFLTRDSSLTTLTGLDSLSSVGGLFINQNPLLQSIGSLRHRLSGNALLPLVIEDNKSLLSLYGLDGITGCDYFRCANNDGLNSLVGLDNLTICRGEFQVMNNDNLLNVNGLESLSEIVGPLTVINNVKLNSLLALENLHTIDGYLYMQGNASLPNLDGLHNLQTLGGIDLTNNENIENVNALSNITSLNLLWVRDNISLSNCCGFYPVLSTNGANGIEIYGNPSGCNNVLDLLDSCEPEGIDLELSMSSSNVDPAVYTSTGIDLVITNTGGEAATGIVVEFKRPAGTVYTGGNEYTSSQGSFNPFGPETWTVGELAAGETATLTVSYFMLTADALTPYAQVVGANETDADSSPGNGTCCTPNEDDEATLTLNAFAGGGTAFAKKDRVGRPVVLVAINPNPVYHGETSAIIDSKVEGTFDLEVYDLFGRVAFSQKVDLREGKNEVYLNVSDLRSGTYLLNMPGQNWRNLPIRLVVARW